MPNCNDIEPIDEWGECPENFEERRKLIPYPGFSFQLYVKELSGTLFLEVTSVNPITGTAEFKGKMFKSGSNN